MAMSDFINFKEVIPEEGETWKGKRILSFDIDWAIDEVIHDVLDVVEGADVRATFFVTHYTKCIDRIRSNPKLELGIHPNFNPLLEKAQDANLPLDTLRNLIEFVPEAKVIRSHSMTI